MIVRITQVDVVTSRRDEPRDVWKGRMLLDINLSAINHLANEAMAQSDSVVQADVSRNVIDTSKYSYITIVLS